MDKQVITVVLQRTNISVPWGFSLAGGIDQGLTHKIGTIREESIADEAGLKKMDFLWKVNGVTVFGLTHGACVKLLRESGTRLELIVERGSLVVPSFDQIRSKNNPKSANSKQRKQLTGQAYYRDAMQDHGLPGKIPTRFTTCGKPFLVENIQFNSPIEVYKDEVIDEMVRNLESHPNIKVDPGKVMTSCRPVRNVRPDLMRTISDEMEGKWKN